MDAQHHRMGVCLPRGLGAAAPTEPGVTRSPAYRGSQDEPTPHRWALGGRHSTMHHPPWGQVLTSSCLLPGAAELNGTQPCPARSHLHHGGYSGSFCCSYVHCVFREGKRKFIVKSVPETRPRSALPQLAQLA